MGGASQHIYVYMWVSIYSSYTKVYSVIYDAGSGHLPRGDDGVLNREEFLEICVYIYVYMWVSGVSKPDSCGQQAG